MTIQYLGHASFKLKGKEASVLIDPYDSSVGKNFPKQSDVDIVLTSHDHSDHNNVAGVNGEYFHIKGPGEYDIKNVSISGIFSYHDAVEGKERGSNTIYVIDLEGISFCHLGDLGTILTDEQVEAIGGVNVLFIPVGGKYTIDAATAVKVISQIEPSIVIPMHFGNTKLGLEDVDVFLKEMGVEKITEKNLKITRDDFSDVSEGTRVIVMES